MSTFMFVFGCLLTAAGTVIYMRLCPSRSLRIGDLDWSLKRRAATPEPEPSGPVSHPEAGADLRRTGDFASWEDELARRGRPDVRQRGPSPRRDFEHWERELRRGKRR
jgi:hypothetical protein